MSQALSIDLNESEVHLLRLAIIALRSEWDEYLADPKVNPQWGLTETVKQRALRLKRLSSRFSELASV